MHNDRSSLKYIRGSQIKTEHALKSEYGNFLSKNNCQNSIDIYLNGR